MTEKIKLSNDEITTLLICSVRYALRRSSYVTGNVADLVEKYAKHMHDAQKELIRKDIEKYLTTLTEHDYDCDIKQWQRTLEVLTDEIAVDEKICDCGKKLTEEEIEYYGYFCNECEEKVCFLDGENDSELPNITGYIVIPPEEYDRLRRLDENVKKKIEFYKSDIYNTGHIIELLESLDK